MRSIAPGLYRDGDPRGPAWEELLEREVGSLVADPDGINAVDAKELNRRLFVVAQRLADDVMSMHLHALLDRHPRMGLKRRLQSMYAVGMVAFLEIPYYFAWSFQSRDRTLQEELRAYFLGERRHTRREKVAVLCASAPHALQRRERTTTTSVEAPSRRRRGRDAADLLGGLRDGRTGRRRLPRARLAAVAERRRAELGRAAAGGGRGLPRGGGVHAPSTPTRRRGRAWWPSPPPGCCTCR